MGRGCSRVRSRTAWLQAAYVGLRRGQAELDHRDLRLLHAGRAAGRLGDLCASKSGDGNDARMRRTRVSVVRGYEAYARMRRTRLSPYAYMAYAAMRRTPGKRRKR